MSHSILCLLFHINVIDSRPIITICLRIFKIKISDNSSYILVILRMFILLIICAINCFMIRIVERFCLRSEGLFTEMLMSIF